MARTSNRLQQLQKALIRGLGVPCPELNKMVLFAIKIKELQRAHSRKFSLDRPGHILRLYRNGLNRQREIPQERTVLLRKNKITHGLVLSSELDSRFFEETFNVLVQRTLVETAETLQSLFHESITKILHDVYDKIRFRSHVSF